MNESIDITEWDGTLESQFDDNPLHYEPRVDDGEVHLVEPSPTDLHKYSIDRFTDLTSEREWILADNEWENQQYNTPDGTIVHLAQP